MKIFKVADIIESRVRLTDVGARTTDTAVFLTNLNTVDDADVSSTWILHVLIGKGPAARMVELQLQPQLNSRYSPTEPFALLPSPLLFFRNRLFLPEHHEDAYIRAEEFSLRVKKHVFLEDAELAGLRETVANLEAAAEGNATRNRVPIPRGVKLLDGQEMTGRASIVSLSRICNSTI